MEAVKQRFSARLLGSFPEVWFIIIISGCTIPEWFAIGNQASNLLIPIFSLVILALLIKQSIHRSRILSGIIGSVFAICSIYMLIAMISEFHEFPVVNMQAVTLISVGTALIGTSMIAAIVMLIRAIVG